MRKVCKKEFKDIKEDIQDLKETTRPNIPRKRGKIYGDPMVVLDE